MVFEDLIFLRVDLYPYVVDRVIWREKEDKGIGVIKGGTLGDDEGSQGKLISGGRCEEKGDGTTAQDDNTVSH